MEHTTRYYTDHLSESFDYFTQCVRDNGFAPERGLLKDAEYEAAQLIAEGRSPQDVWMVLVKRWAPGFRGVDLSLRALHAAIAVEYGSAVSDHTEETP